MSTADNSSTDIINAAEVVQLLDAFKAANPGDWLQQLHRKATVLGPYTVGGLTTAIRADNFMEWQPHVPTDERDEILFSFSEFVRIHYGAELPEWTPDPHYRVVFSHSAQAAHRNYEGRPRSHFKDLSPAKHSAVDLADSADDDLGPAHEEDIDMPPAVAAAGAPVKKQKPKEGSVITVDKIASSMHATQMKTGSLKLKGVIRHGPLANRHRTWQLVAKHCDLKEFIKNDFRIKVADICASAAMTYKATKKRTLEGVIKHGPLADGIMTWEYIKQGLDSKRLGYIELNPYRNLSALLDANNVEKPPYFTRQEVIDTLLRTRKKTGAWPPERGSIDYPPLKGQIKKWKSVENAMRLELNGITKEEFPYDTWRELMIDEGHIKPLHLSVNLITASAFATWLASMEEHGPDGRWPAAEDGIIMHGPLADGETTWKKVEDAIRNKRFGLTDEHCPYSKGLYELLIGEGFLVEPFNLTVDLIAKSALATFHKTKRWPMADDHVAVQDGPLAGLITWRQIADAIEGHYRGLTQDKCPYDSLPQLLEGEFGKPARDLHYKYEQPAPAA